MADTLSSPRTGDPLDSESLRRFRVDFRNDPRYRTAMNAVAATGVNKVALDREAVVQRDFSFSVHLPENKATSQMSSGRCWLFAALNVMRVHAIANMKLDDDFELSQNHLMFWDKLEKANYFLESVLQTLDESTDGRLVNWIFRDPIQDGGQWHMFVNLVQKYGVVPKTVMPETESSGNTGWMNRMVTAKLREHGATLRRLHRDGVSEHELCAAKNDAMVEVYRMLAIHLGEPPTDFHWQWRDKDRNFHRDGRITPQEFFAKHVQVDLDDYVCLIHCPQATKSMNTLYTIRFLGNVVGGKIVEYVNVPLDVMKEAAIAQLKDGESVWFGCDVGQFLDRDLGVLDTRLFDFASIYGTAPRLDKAARLDYGQSLMTHAMVFTGVDLDAHDRPVKWRVENSWGEKGGDQGFLMMTDAWFDEYNYEVAVHKKYLSPAVLAILDQTPVELEPWDPMGSLAI